MLIIFVMAEAFIAHMYAMAGTFAASTAIWFSIRAARGEGRREEGGIGRDVKGEEKIGG